VAPQTELPQLSKQTLLLFLKAYDAPSQQLRVRTWGCLVLSLTLCGSPRGGACDVVPWLPAEHLALPS
jgi:hypothetical protein